MNTVHFVPLERFEERYTADWYRWFDAEFKRRDLKVWTHAGETLVNGIGEGEFLDVCSTNYHKASQLQSLMRAVHSGSLGDGDVVFIMDLWFPGLEMLAYVRDALGVKFKICGIYHAGTYDPWDYLSLKGMGRWGGFLERSWAEIVDTVMVSTGFHAHLLRERGFRRIAVTGLPVKGSELREEYAVVGKDRLVVFPHRFAHEKMPATFRRLAPYIEENFGAECVCSRDVVTCKSDLYDLLARASVAVSCAWQETFGIVMLEAAALGCTPVVPDRVSYPEIFAPRFRYNSEEQMLDMILKGLDTPFVPQSPYENAERVIVDHVEEMLG